MPASIGRNPVDEGYRDTIDDTPPDMAFLPTRALLSWAGDVRRQTIIRPARTVRPFCSRLGSDERRETKPPFRHHPDPDPPYVTQLRRSAPRNGAIRSP